MLAGAAEEEQAAAVRRQRDPLVGVGAVEDHRVGAVLALDGVAAVARVPDERVVAGTEEGDVVAAVAVDRVVAVAAEQRLVARAAGDRVVSVSTVDRRRRCVSVKTPLLSSMRTKSSPDAASTSIVGDVLAVEPEGVLAVVADVDLELVGTAGLQAKRDRCRPRSCPSPSARRARASGA